MRGKLNDINGMKFGKWTVVDGPHSGKYPGAWWGAVCECGDRHVVYGRNLKNGQSTQCRPCKHKEAQTHGGTGTRLFIIWTGAKSRCTKENKDARNYYDRGIRVCDEWLNDFSAFQEWALANGYKENLSLDRIDGNGNYSPDNCRWATDDEQHQNTRRTKLNANLVFEMRRLSESGMNAREIADLFNAPHVATYKAVSRQTWKNIEQPNSAANIGA